MAEVASEEKFWVNAEFTPLSKPSKTREEVEEDGILIPKVVRR